MHPGHRLALITLVDRVADVIDVTTLRKLADPDSTWIEHVEQTVRDQSKAMQAEGEAPEGMDMDLLAHDALQELVGFGPLANLLDDPNISEIHCLRHDHIISTRGDHTGPAPIGFTSEESLAAAILRLAHQSGVPLVPGETIVERRLPRGATLLALLTPLVPNSSLAIRKGHREESSIDELVRTAGMSEAMARTLHLAVKGGINLLICGEDARAAGLLLSAIATAVPTNDRVVALQDADAWIVPHSHTVTLPLADPRYTGESLVSAAARLHVDRLFIGNLTHRPGVAAATMDALFEGTRGVVGAMVAPSLRLGLARLAAQLMVGRPGITFEAACEVVANSFEATIEVVTTHTGTLRVTRIAEPVSTTPEGVTVQNLFVSLDGSGGFAASGVVPEWARHMSSRGFDVDLATFKKS